MSLACMVAYRESQKYLNSKVFEGQTLPCNVQCFLGSLHPTLLAKRQPDFETFVPLSFNYSESKHDFLLEEASININQNID